MKVRLFHILVLLFILATKAHALDMFESINKANLNKNSTNYETIDNNRNNFTNDIFDTFSNNFSIEFVYSSQCGFCHKLSHILKGLQNTYQLKIESISADGGIIPGFEDAIYSEKFLQENEIKAYPVLIAKNKSNQRYMLATGYISKDELKNNIEVLFNYIKGGRNA